ncbi:MAG: hypothetical protein IKZ25_02110 [Clostridia bacterium]|nr:hypothetical protein [Clostridia bacterium]
MARKKQISEKSAFAVGVIVLVLAAIILGLVLFQGYRIASRFLNSGDNVFVAPTVTGEENEISTEYVRESKEWFDEYIKFAVMLDFPDFKDVNELSDENIITFAIFQIISNTPHETLDMDKDGNSIVSKKDVDAYIDLYFNLSRDVKHKSIENTGITYNSFTSKYKAPSIGYDDCNIPKVINVEYEKSGYVNLDVEYYNSIELMTATDENGAKPVKNVEMTLAPNGKVFRFVGIRTIK